MQWFRILQQPVTYSVGCCDRKKLTSLETGASFSSGAHGAIRPWVRPWDQSCLEPAGDRVARHSHVWGDLHDLQCIRDYPPSAIPTSMPYAWIMLDSSEPRDQFPCSGFVLPLVKTCISMMDYNGPRADAPAHILQVLPLDPRRVRRVAGKSPPESFKKSLVARHILSLSAILDQYSCLILGRDHVNLFSLSVSISQSLPVSICLHLSISINVSVYLMISI